MWLNFLVKMSSNVNFWHIRKYLNLVFFLLVLVYEKWLRYFLLFFKNHLDLLSSFFISQFLKFRLDQMNQKNQLKILINCRVLSISMVLLVRYLEMMLFHLSTMIYLLSYIWYILFGITVLMLHTFKKSLQYWAVGL